MHKPVKERLEEYLQSAGSGYHPQELDSHLQSCDSCRAEVDIMSAQARLLHGLRPEEEIEVAPGFYARVMAAVEARRSAAGLLAFADPTFGRRFIYACLATVILLGSYFLYTERAVPFGDQSPVRMLIADTPYERRLGTDQELDREAVLLSLASYRE